MSVNCLNFLPIQAHVTLALAVGNITVNVFVFLVTWVSSRMVWVSSIRGSVLKGEETVPQRVPEAALC